MAIAIYHLHTSVIKRSDGRSATAAIAYRAGTCIVDRRTGLIFDYQARGGVEYTQILAPDYAPDWCLDRSELWNRVEEAETRSDSQVAREVRVALPVELQLKDQISLVQGYVQSQFVDKGMIADIALHSASDEGDERNIHAHILLTTRDIDVAGFGLKNRSWNRTDALREWRAVWARVVNSELAKTGSDARIDHRTLKAQYDEALVLAEEAQRRGDVVGCLHQAIRAVSLDRMPLPSLSLGAWALKSRGEVSEAVEIWRGAKDYALEVKNFAQALRQRVDDFLSSSADRAADVFGVSSDDFVVAGASPVSGWFQTSNASINPFRFLALVPSIFNTPKKDSQSVEGDPLDTVVSDAAPFGPALAAQGPPLERPSESREVGALQTSEVAEQRAGMEGGGKHIHSSPGSGQSQSGPVNLKDLLSREFRGKKRVKKAKRATASKQGAEYLEPDLDFPEEAGNILSELDDQNSSNESSLEQPLQEEDHDLDSGPGMG